MREITIKNRGNTQLRNQNEGNGVPCTPPNHRVTNKWLTKHLSDD